MEHDKLNMKQFNSILLLTALLILFLSMAFPHEVFSQPPPPPPPSSGHGLANNQPAGAGAPVGEGIWILIALAFSYSIYHVIRRREKQGEGNESMPGIVFETSAGAAQQSKDQVRNGFTFNDLNRKSKVGGMHSHRNNVFTLLNRHHFKKGYMVKRRFIREL